MSLQGQGQIGLEFGAFGIRFVTSSTDVSDKKFAIIEGWGGDAVVTFTDRAENNKTGLHETITVPDGRRIYGNLENLSVASGTLLAYYQIDQRTENES
jgi:hypothetical protein